MITATAATLLWSFEPSVLIKSQDCLDCSNSDSLGLTESPPPDFLYFDCDVSTQGINILYVGVS